MSRPIDSPTPAKQRKLPQKASNASLTVDQSSNAEVMATDKAEMEDVKAVDANVSASVTLGEVMEQPEQGHQADVAAATAKNPSQEETAEAESYPELPEDIVTGEEELLEQSFVEETAVDKDSDSASNFESDETTAESDCSDGGDGEEFPIHKACFYGDVTLLKQLLHLNESRNLMRNFRYLSLQLTRRVTLLVPKSKVLRARTTTQETSQNESSDGTTPSASSSTAADPTDAMNETVQETASESSEVEGAGDGNDSSSETSTEDGDEWVTIKGCPAELAVHGGQYLCARITLSMMLLIRIKHSGWAERGFSTFRDTMHLGFSILHMKIGSNEGSSFIATLPFLDFQLETSGIESLKVLLAGCLLGLVNVVKAVIEKQVNDFWEQRFPGPYHNWITNAESTLLAAATGGDAECLKLVLEKFHSEIRLHLISSTEDAILNVLWGWKVAEMKDCLQQLKKAFPQARHGRLPLTTFVDAIAYTGSWLSYGSHDALLLCYKKTLPSSQEVFTNMCDVMQIYQQKWRDRWDYEASSAIIATWNAGKVKDKLKDHTELEGMLESFICQILTRCNREVPGSIMLDKDLLYFLCLKKVDYRKGFLLTVCQCWYVTRDKIPRTCPMCHPLVSFVLFAAYEACYFYLVEDGLLSTMASCFSLREISNALQLLEMPRNESQWCQAHRSHPGRNFLGTLHHSSPRVLQMLEECLEMNCLQHLSVQTLLDSLDGECTRVRTKDIPGPLMRYIGIDQFLKKW